MLAQTKRYHQQLEELRSVALQMEPGSALKKSRLLEALTNTPPLKAKDLLAYHDCLLQMLAYPANRTMFKATATALSSLMEFLTEVFSGNNYRLQQALAGSGVAGSTITGSFSYAITKWLSENFPGDVEIESSQADPESVRISFSQILPRTEYENIFSGELRLVKRIQKLKGRAKGSLVNWLIHQIDSTTLSDRDKEAFFHHLQIFISWKLNNECFNRTRSAGLNGKTFFHSTINKQADIKKIVSKELPPAGKLTESEKIHLVNTGRSVLAFLHRETEPFTYAENNEVIYFELERGLGIALYSMNAERRLSIESYIGYLAFKNGIPVAYGGGWLFGQRCQFGINILPPFRGGESAFLFYQLLRLYKQYFGAERFVVKPYQFGKNNNEALQSGAFWFYYKAGFRPEDNSLQQLAITEYKKRKKDKEYRTPVHLLKKFTSSNLCLDFSENSFPRFDAAFVSVRITDFINQQFEGNRDYAMLICESKTKKQLGFSSLHTWTRHEIKVFREWSLLVQALLNIEKWTDKEKKLLVRIIRAKGNFPEINFIRLIQKHKRFWTELAKSVL
jgi:hypothetical protein